MRTYPSVGNAGQGGHLSGAEKLLWESVERGLRQGRDLVVLVLHLSRLVAPAPRPHHIRVARVLLQDTATRYGGQVFGLRNQDMVLLAPAGTSQLGKPAGENGTLVVHEPGALPDTIERLFSADIPPSIQLTSLLRLGSGDPGALTGYLGSCARMPAAALPVQRHDPVLGLGALETILDHTPLAELLVLRTGMRLGPDRHDNLAERLIPAFRSIQLSFSALHLDPLVAQATSDPFLARYMAGGLDARLIELLSEDLTSGGGLTREAVQRGIPVHIELGVPAVLSSRFAQFLRQATGVGLRLGVAMPLMQASADFEALDEALRILAADNAELVITGIDLRELHYARVARLGCGFVKLNWSPNVLNQSLGKVAAAAQLFGSPSLDVTRTVLQGVDSATALGWGQSHGLVFYEGPFLDQFQAANRMRSCRHSTACSLQQCYSRARAVGEWGRTGCRSIALLDASRFEAGAMQSAA